MTRKPNALLAALEAARPPVEPAPEPTPEPERQARPLPKTREGTRTVSTGPLEEVTRSSWRVGPNQVFSSFASSFDSICLRMAVQISVIVCARISTSFPQLWKPVGSRGPGVYARTGGRKQESGGRSLPADACLPPPFNSSIYKASRAACPSVQIPLAKISNPVLRSASFFTKTPHTPIAPFMLSIPHPYALLRGGVRAIERGSVLERA